MSGRAVLFEHRIMGAWARVAAIDEATGVEVVAIGPASADREGLEQLALRKLERALERRDAGPAVKDTRGGEYR